MQANMRRHLAKCWAPHRFGAGVELSQMSKCFTISLAGDLRMGLGMGNEQEAGAPGAHGLELTKILKRLQAPLPEGGFAVIFSRVTA